MRTKTMSQATYRYRLYQNGKRIDTGGACSKESVAVAQAIGRLAQNSTFTATIEKRDAGKSRYRELYQLD